MVSFPNGRHLTLVRRTVTSRDSDGNDTYTAEQLDIPGCAVWVQRGGTTEQVQGRDTVTAIRVALFPPGTDVKATDQVIVDGVLYDIDGEPLNWISPISGYNSGVQVFLMRVTG